MALLEFFLTAAWARIIPADILQRIANRIMAMVAVRAVDVPLICMVVFVIVVAIRTVHVGFMVHRCCLLGDKVAGDYLAIGGDVHAPTEQQARFQLTFQTIGDWPVRLFQ